MIDWDDPILAGLCGEGALLRDQLRTAPAAAWPATSVDAMLDYLIWLRTHPPPDREHSDRCAALIEQFQRAK